VVRYEQVIYMRSKCTWSSTGEPPEHLRVIVVHIAGFIHPRVNRLVDISFDWLSLLALEPRHVGVLRMEQLDPVVVGGQGGVLAGVHITAVATRQTLRVGQVGVLGQRHRRAVSVHALDRLRGEVRQRRRRGLDAPQVVLLHERGHPHVGGATERLVLHADPLHHVHRDGPRHLPPDDDGALGGVLEDHPWVGFGDEGGRAGAGGVGGVPLQRARLPLDLLAVLD
jgi:hypothetical protein